jgi:hypothetical protein
MDWDALNDLKPVRVIDEEIAKTFIGSVRKLGLFFPVPFHQPDHLINQTIHFPDHVL